jgi:hypothetical protein
MDCRHVDREETGMDIRIKFLAVKQRRLSEEDEQRKRSEPDPYFDRPAPGLRKENPGLEKHLNAHHMGCAEEQKWQTRS